MANRRTTLIGTFAEAATLAAESLRRSAISASSAGL